MRVFVMQPDGIAEAVYTTPLIRALISEGHEVSVGVPNRTELTGYLLYMSGMEAVLPLEPAAAIRRECFESFIVCSDDVKKWDNLRMEYAARTWASLPPVDKDQHLAEHIFDLAEAFRIKGKRPPPEVPIADPFTLPGVRPRLVICSGPDHKEYGPQYSELARWFKDEHKGAVILMGDDLRAVDKPLSLPDVLVSSISSMLTYPQIVGALRSADVVVGSSGLAHIAAVQGTPTIGLCKPGFRKQLAPIGRSTSCLELGPDVMRKAKTAVTRLLKKAGKS